MLRVFSFANNILDCEVSQEKQKKFLESFQKKCENKTDDLIIVIGSKNSFIEISKIFSLNHETLEDTNNIDEMVRYTSYQDFDFISMSFGTDDIKKNEINIYLNNNYLFICFPEEEIAEIKKINEILEKRITSSTKIRHTAIVRCIYDLFDSIILEYSNILEMTEDQVEELQREISSNHKKFNLDKIDIIRKKTFFMRKQLRAMEKLQGFIDNESIKWITKKVKKLFTSIFLRIEGVSRFSDSIYKACAELLRIYDAKITSETNMVVTRLTAITLIVGMWTVVAGLYGMNVWLPGGDDPYSFYIIIGILVVLTVVLLIFFVFKKII